MASFGRKPARGNGRTGATVVNTSSVALGRPSGAVAHEALQRLKEEEVERERFAREYEDRQQRARDEDSERERKSRAPPPVVIPTPQAAPAPARAGEGRPNPHVFLQVEVRGPELLGRPGKVEASGRMEFELFADVVPKTAENFRCLCTGERGPALHFENSIFHRIIPGFMAQGGDITDGDGTGGKSIYGPTFNDEGFSRRHDGPGVLSMANSGKHTNNSQFFMLFKPAPWLDSKHVVFGRLVREEGQMLRRIEGRGSKSGDVKGIIKIVKSGTLSASSAAAASRTMVAASSPRASRTTSRRRRPSQSSSCSRQRWRSRSKSRSLPRARTRSRSRSRARSLSSKEGERGRASRAKPTRKKKKNTSSRSSS
eukprot:TRINITY_DN73582_c0_g1_i1.p1 TRINITY_DN73582_c0_g1~~TRINITY_DN73582_c0_g1_i1.p1  ORF type:complete len:370 (+),score=44.73 TRINITY_DN73582_c0_g1_i1:75-1184(+)